VVNRGVLSSSKGQGDKEVDLSTRIGSLDLAYPTLMGSGCYGSGEEFAPFIDLSKIGGVVLKSVTRAPRLGNPTPRLVQTPAGMLNAIGLQNPGIEWYLEHDVAKFASRPCKIVGSVAGFSVDDYAYVAERLAARSEIHALELNISCPNVASEGETFACDPQLTSRVVKAVRGTTDKTLIVKLSPNVTDIAGIAREAESAGADALAVINTVRGMAIDINTWKPRLGNVTGGLSGPAIRPIALLAVYEVARAVKIPIVGQGGIETTSDALEFFLAGASAISIGTANFTDPRIPVRIVDELREYLAARGIRSLSEIVGKANVGVANPFQYEGDEG
jgi:dihydroorotate dehydrogenase (NAD+) catalytic subunit